MATTTRGRRRRTAGRRTSRRDPAGGKMGARHDFRRAMDRHRARRTIPSVSEWDRHMGKLDRAGTPLGRRSAYNRPRGGRKTSAPRRRR